MSRRDEILESTNGGLLIYELLCGPLKAAGNNRFENVKNPCYSDKKPGLSIYYHEKTKKYRHRDYGDSTFNGDIFTFCICYFGLEEKGNFHLVLDKITELLESDDEKLKELKKSIPTKVHQEELHQPIKSYHIKDRSAQNFTSSEKDYFLQYGIDIKTLSEYMVYAVDAFESITDNKSFTKQRGNNELIFAYKGHSYAKIYIPHPKYFQWLGKKPKDYAFGYGLIDESRAPYDCPVFITSGEKDVLTLAAHGYLAVCTNSETSSFPIKILNYLKYWFPDIIVVYDIDSTGMKESEKLCAQHDLKRLVLPQQMLDRGLGKDVSDFFKIVHNPELAARHNDFINENTFENLIISASVPFNKEDTQEKRGTDLVVQNNLPAVRIAFRKANKRLEDARNQAPTFPLVGCLWESNEVAILFGDTGIGKSILGVAIAEAVSRGENFLFLINENAPQVCLYYDFELSDKQFGKRYTSEDGTLFEFHDNFHSDTINFQEIIVEKKGEKFDEILFEKIKEDIERTNASVIFIDNITFLKTESQQDGQVALEIMKKLVEIKKIYKISILVLAHTPKLKGSTNITINQLAGSKHLSNFSDSIFAIGTSHKDKNLRYIKQIKSRNSEVIYDTGNVMVCELVKKGSFLTFEFREFGDEADHIKVFTSDDKKELKDETIKLYKQGKSCRDIAKIIGVSSSTIDRWIQEYKRNNNSNENEK